MKQWKMPKWMERYRELIGNTGGNSVEELMNNTTVTADTNLVLSVLCISVKSQVNLLERMYAKGLIPTHVGR